MSEDNKKDHPFNEDQQQWLSGFFAGANSRLLKDGGDTQAQDTKTLKIIFGTQTGNAETIGEAIVERAGDFGLNAELVDMYDVEAENLAKMENVLVICSTYGEGEMPDNAQILWDAISEDDAPNLAELNFSVLALGDRSYDDFCKAGIDWDIRLAELGAKRILNLVECDIDFEDDAEAWSDAILEALKVTGGSAAATESATSKTAGKPAYDRKNPFPANVLVNKVISGKNSSKEIVHYEISLKDSGLTYEAGDALNIVPQNDPELINLILAQLGLSGDEQVDGQKLSAAMKNIYDIKLPTAPFLEQVAKKSGDEELTRMLENNDKEALNSYLWGRDMIDFITDLKITFTADEFVPLLRKLQPRAYSISSSSKAHADQVHLTISSVRYESFERKHEGVASCYLADRVGDNDKVGVYFSPNKAFRVPQDSNLPIIMVGPGTGVAPFRAFLEERQATDAKGDNWLIFGDRKAADDFIYQDEIEAWQKSGFLTKLDLAFSRDQADKIYVQTRMKQNGAELFKWLERGGYFYVCGDATYMAKDVDQTLEAIVAEHGKLDAAGVKNYMNGLKKAKRYVRDVY